MLYLIDGHNLIGQMPDLSFEDPHDEAKLVERLRGYMGRLSQRCTVVFDGGLPGGPSRDLSTPGVQVIFAHGGTTADRIILARISAARDPGALVIVSGDQELRNAAERRKIRVMSAGEFLAAMRAARQPPPGPDGSEANPRISPREVDEWLALFGNPDDENR